MQAWPMESGSAIEDLDAGPAVRERWERARSRGWRRQHRRRGHRAPEEEAEALAPEQRAYDDARRLVNMAAVRAVGM